MNSISTPAPTARILLACGLMVASGFAALAYQIVWTQQSALWLGHESPAVLAVVAAFFGGLALGSLVFGHRIERSEHPTRWYASCEIVIGVWSLALSLLLSPVSNALLDLTGAQPSALRHWLLAFSGTFFLLLPATMAMGATLPAMERVLHRLWPRSTTLSLIYASNTLGAMIGVLAAACWLIPELGLWRTAASCAVLNLICALGVLRLQAKPMQMFASTSTRAAARGLLSILAATGLLGIGYEVLMVRALSQVTENTVYTFAMLLAVYLAGTAIGAWAYSQWIVRRGAAPSARDPLLQLLAATCAFGILTISAAEKIKTAMLEAFGSSLTVALGAEAIIGTTAFLLPTIVMGALFSHLSTRARAGGIDFGRALGVNTLGAAFAPALFGVVLVPQLGLKASLLLVVLGYLVLTTPSAWIARSQWAAIVTCIAVLLASPSLLMTTVPEGGRIVAHKEGIMGSVSVVEDANGIASLHINNRQQEGSSATLFADARQALLPLLLHPEPRRALFLGVGTGLTASSAAADPDLQIDAVELVPEVLDVADYFKDALPASIDTSRVKWMSGDGRRTVRTTPHRYDIIVSDNFHPARSGSGSLYTVEHFRAVKSRLNAGGLFCQWLPLHQLDIETLRSIVRSYLAVYPQGAALLATNSLSTPVVGLISYRDAARIDHHQLQARLARGGFTIDLSAFGIEDDFAVLGSFIADGRSLERFSARAPLNTDDRPVVAYRAPRITYAEDSAPLDRLLALLGELEMHSASFITSDDVEWRRRLRAYWAARDRFIEAGRSVEPTYDVQHMVAQVREPLLSVLEVSPEFRPAYDPLLQMGIALANVDENAARTLLKELAAAQPARVEASQALQTIGVKQP